MKNFYLIDYLRDSEYLDSSKFDLLKYELDKRIYSYGEHLKSNREKNITNNFYNIYKEKLKLFIIDIFFIFLNNSKIKENTVISNAYFNFSNEIKNIGYEPVTSPWSWISLKDFFSYPLYNKFFLDKVRLFKYKLDNFAFNQLLEQTFLLEIDNLLELFEDFFKNKNIKSIFIPYDLSFFERLSIKTFKNLSKPSFVCLHGFGGVYSKVDDTSADYLIVFGEKIKSNYVKLGVNKDKILVSGHPFYKEDKSKSKLKFSLDNILVLTKVTYSFPWSIEGSGLSIDRSRSILYLYSIQKILKKFGVKKVRFRIHPSENILWYKKFIDNSFFVPDLLNLKESITSSTLVIGGNSTVFIESIYNGVNYIVYEPMIYNKDLNDTIILPPFDGSENRIIIAKNEEDLEIIIKNKICNDPSFFGDYIKTPFDISFLKKLI